MLNNSLDLNARSIKFASLLMVLLFSTDAAKAETKPNTPALPDSPTEQTLSNERHCDQFSADAKVNTIVTADSCTSGENFVTTAVLRGAALFSFDSNELSPEGDNALKRLIDDLRQFSQIRHIHITGHADSSGPAVYNQYLSEIRAKAIGEYFSTAFPTTSLQITGKGETEPVTSNATWRGRYQNRRVHIEVTAVR